MAVIVPQVEAFQMKLASNEEEFRGAFEAILDPEQKGKLKAIQQQLKRIPGPLPGCGPEMGPIFVSTVIYKPLQQRLSEDLNLTGDQRQKLGELLLARRNKLLALVDNTPPPSFKLGDFGGSQPAPSR